MSEGVQKDIPSYFQPGQVKRVHPSTSDESDTSVVYSTPAKPVEKKRHLMDNTQDSMAMQEALVKINQRLDALATRDDVAGIRSEVQQLTDTFLKKIQQLEGRVFEAEAKTDKLQAEAAAAKKKTEELQNMMRRQDNLLKQNESATNDLQQYSRRWNLRVYRVPEAEGETSDDCIKKVCRIFSGDVGVSCTPADVEVAHRAGQRSRDKARPILVRFFDRKKRDAVIGARRALKNKGTVIGEDLTSANYKLSNEAFRHSATMSVWSSNGKVLAKLKNGQVMRLNIHMNLDLTFGRAMSSNRISDIGDP